MNASDIYNGLLNAISTTTGINSQNLNSIGRYCKPLNTNNQNQSNKNNSNYVPQVKKPSRKQINASDINNGPLNTISTKTVVGTQQSNSNGRYSKSLNTNSQNKNNKNSTNYARRFKKPSGKPINASDINNGLLSTISSKTGIGTQYSNSNCKTLNLDNGNHHQFSSNVEIVNEISRKKKSTKTSPNNSKFWRLGFFRQEKEFLKSDPTGNLKQQIRFMKVFVKKINILNRISIVFYFSILLKSLRMRKLYTRIYF